MHINISYTILQDFKMYIKCLNMLYDTVLYIQRMIKIYLYAVHNEQDNVLYVQELVFSLMCLHCHIHGGNPGMLILYDLKLCTSHLR